MNANEMQCIYDSISYKNINPLKVQYENIAQYEILVHMNGGLTIIHIS